MRFENDPLSVWTPKTETFENASNSFVERLLITMAFKLAIGACWHLLTQGIALKQGLTTPFVWNSVNPYRFHSVFICKRSNVNGQRFHQRKRIETETEQCQHSHCLPLLSRIESWWGNGINRPLRYSRRSLDPATFSSIFVRKVRLSAVSPCSHSNILQNLNRDCLMQTASTRNRHI